MNLEKILHCVSKVSNFRKIRNFIWNIFFIENDKTLLISVNSLTEIKTNILTNEFNSTYFKYQRKILLTR